MAKSDTDERTAGGDMPRVVLGVTGGIAAYKSVAIVRGLRAAGCDVHVVPTPDALTMVGITTWEAISGHPVYTAVTDAAAEVAHVRMGGEADLLLIAPATANTLAKLACGLADNLLTATALVATCPVLIAPAMHTQMWNHPATQANVSTLLRRGVQIIGPDVGRLTGADSGPGRMSEPDEIVRAALDIVRTLDTATTQAGISQRGGRSQQTDEALAGLHIVISAGGTHEPIDPVRFIGNRSTGHMGVALANAAQRGGANVTLVAANLSRDVYGGIHPGVDVHSVVTAQELYEQMCNLAQQADVVVMAAAVADYRPVSQSPNKIKKSSGGIHTLTLEETPDILAELAHRRSRPEQLIVGFAAETGDDSHTALDYGKEKAARKGADMIVVNEVGQTTGFGAVPTSVTLIDADGRELTAATGSKTTVGAAIMGCIAAAARDRGLL
ncbi:MAG: bifunctional phosphopantothenoylcysteine decarboxylase/phosphopantothenate--cysteine ligase CoaBC [Actinomycetaceae bacterium]|nr:bifunctional phosphopantothenoylcysteine decarboxylase/phosphopantothenate--cysteine ligase CoaBC [Arcanobacterium sp.]MDD7686437.1 bifunctional phosphopantothenoylcysteine decarboxylase/phosphopantothenate--cysteine ligase CoaBC [Actinomycetaceae bacterium]MDY5272717.1 bifunctional phosphopantothenoylcysteine decarboxylase/phosphopantothenate--cysteine ligase CoaBC [Arcanobacterium sp.]